MRAINYTAYCSIYKISCIITSNVYIGQSWLPIKRRFSGHKCDANKKTSRSYKSKLANAIRKYGIENFYIEVITVCGTQETADYWESYFIKQYDSINNGYNIREGGSRGKFSQSTKDKMSLAKQGANHPNFGKHHSEETKEKISIAQIEHHKSTPMSEEIRLQISTTLTGRKASEDTKVKMYISRSGENHPMYGKHHTDETKNKISNTLKERNRKSQQTISNGEEGK